MKLEYADVPLDQLTPYAKNPRQGDVGAIAVSLEANGQYRPIVVNKTNNEILAGNHTYHAAVALGWDTIQVGYVDVDEATAKRIVVVDNRLNDLADYDRNVLADLLSEIYDESGPEGLLGTGFDTDDFEEAVAVSDGSRSSPWDDRVKQERVKPGKVKKNTVWQVGPHILACGDSTDPDLWDELLAERQASLLFTDPPYGVDYSGGGVERVPLAGDTPDEAPILLAAVLDAVAPVMAAGASTYVCLPAGDVLPSLAAVLAERHLWRWALSWCKGNATFGRADYHQEHEIIAYGWYPTGPHHKVTDRTETSVWHIPRPTDSDLHPTAKPVELSARAIRNSTRPGQIVVEPFAGSGSTLVGCHREGRVGVGVEIEPGYVNAALGWLEDETGESRTQLR